jgi:hypothetical protein
MGEGVRELDAGEGGETVKVALPDPRRGAEGRVSTVSVDVVIVEDVLGIGSRSVSAVDHAWGKAVSRAREGW